MLLPVSQFGSSKDMAGMMQRLLYCHACLYEAFVLSSSLRAVLVDERAEGRPAGRPPQRAMGCAPTCQHVFHVARGRGSVAVAHSKTLACRATIFRIPYALRNREPGQVPCPGPICSTGRVEALLPGGRCPCATSHSCQNRAPAKPTMPVCASERTSLVLAKIMNAAALDVRRMLCARTPMSAVPARMPMDELEPDDEQDDD